MFPFPWKNLVTGELSPNWSDYFDTVEIPAGAQVLSKKGPLTTFEQQEIIYFLPQDPQTGFLLQGLNKISHDFKNTLGTIHGYAQLLEASLEGEEASYASVIRQRSRLMISQLQNVLDTARHMSGAELPWAAQSLSLPTLVQFLKKNIPGATFSMEPENVVLDTDKKVLLSLIQEIHTNQSRYHAVPDPKIQLVYTKETLIVGFPNYCQAGIKIEEFIRPFDPGQTKDGTRPGQGLGMTRVKAYVEFLKGSWELNSGDLFLKLPKKV